MRVGSGSGCVRERRLRSHALKRSGRGDADVIAELATEVEIHGDERILGDLWDASMRAA